MEKSFGRKLLKSKKGSVLDLILLGVFCLGFAFSILIGFKITSEINDNLQSNSLISADGKAAASQLVGEYSTTLDYGFLFFLVGLSIGVLILAAMVRVHPIFIVLYIIGLIFVIFFAAIFSNIYQEVAASPEMSDLADQLFFIDKMMIILPLFVGIVGVILCLTMYKAWNDGEMYG